MSEEWFPIYEIRFNKKQMRWLINHLSDLRDGNWPEKNGYHEGKPKMACKEAVKAGYEGLCVNCPFLPCLNPSEKTPMKVRKERNINRILEIAAEVEVRLNLVLDYISGWPRPDKRIPRRRK